MVEIIGPGAFIPEEKTLVLGDLHIGSDYVLASGGAISPLIGLTEIQEIVDQLIKKTNPEKIVLLGDIQVSFGPVSFREKREIKRLLEHIKNNCEELILIKGNHDKGIASLFDFKEEYELHGYFMTHGDVLKNISTEVHTIFVGHEHPAISITNDIRTEKFKCVIKSAFQGKQLYVLPSVNQLTIGTDVKKEKLLSPYLSEEVMKHAEFIVVEGIHAYQFGRNV